MAENIVTLHPAPVKRPLSSAERGRAFRDRQKNKSAVKSAEAAEKPQTFANANANVREQPNAKRERSGSTDPTFAELERSTAALMAACKRGMEAARAMAAKRLTRREVVSAEEPGAEPSAAS
jgi:hypothetical protein